jgi:hypothetical protein
LSAARHFAKPCVVRRHGRHRGNVADRSASLLRHRDELIRKVNYLNKLRELSPRMTGERAVGYAAHLVPTGTWTRRNPVARRAIENCQRILNEVGIGWDHAANGFFTNSPRHLGTHTNAFFFFLERELAPLAGNRGAIITTLRDIAGQLRSGAIIF